MGVCNEYVDRTRPLFAKKEERKIFVGTLCTKPPQFELMNFESNSNHTQDAQITKEMFRTSQRFILPYRFLEKKWEILLTVSTNKEALSKNFAQDRKSYSKVGSYVAKYTNILEIFLYI